MASGVGAEFDSTDFDRFPSLARLHNTDRVHVDRHQEIVVPPNDAVHAASHK
jgi:hypothetical protein